MAEFGEKSSLCKQPLHSMTYLFKLNINLKTQYYENHCWCEVFVSHCLKILKGHHFQLHWTWMQKFYIIESACVGMVSDQLSVFGENISFLFWEQNIPLKNSVTGKVNMDRCYLISFFSNVSKLIVVQCLYKLENEPDVWIFNFCSPELSCGSKLQLVPVIMLTMILHSLENMKIRKKKNPHWWIVLFGA